LLIALDKRIKCEGGIIMFKMSRKLLMGVLIICVLMQASFIVTAAKPTVQNPIICQIAFTEPPTIKVGNEAVNHPGWAGMLAFQSAMEKYSQGRVKVELFPNGRLGDNKSTLEQVLNGNLLVTTTTDGVLAPFYKRIQVFSAPYIFKDVTTLWNVLDGPFGQKFFDDMAAKSGIRVLTSGNCGLFRCFANRKKELRVPADMKGLKMRVQDSPIFMEMVRACSASPTPVAWMELYSALQTGVVDGMEHAPSSILSSSLQEVQKFYTLNNHSVCISMFVTSEKFFKSLSPDLREAFVKAGQEASVALRNASSYADECALEVLKKSGMKVYNPTPAERKLWEKTREPVLAWLRKNVDSKLVNELLNVVKKQSIIKKNNLDKK
jgi:tripartite ATP-independent transporter DctP family solute receptor